MNKSKNDRKSELRIGSVVQTNQRQDIDDLLKSVGHNEILHMSLHSLLEPTKLEEDFRPLYLLTVLDGLQKLDDGRVR